MTWHVLDREYDPITGLEKEYVWCDETHELRRRTYCRLQDDMFSLNAEQLNATKGQRFGALRQVARVPMDFYHRHIAPAHKAGDQTYIKRLLNDSEFSKLRTFRGRL